jgi:hypothetical protein
VSYTLFDTLTQDEIFHVVDVPGRPHLASLKEEARRWREMADIFFQGEDAINRDPDIDDTHTRRFLQEYQGPAATWKELRDYSTRVWTLWGEQNLAPLSPPENQALEWLWRVADWGRFVVKESKQGMYM